MRCNLTDVRRIVALLLACACARAAPAGPTSGRAVGLTRDELRGLEVGAACGSSDLTLAERARDRELARIGKTVDDYLAAMATYGKDPALRAEIAAAAARCRLDAGWSRQELDGGVVFVR
jgi:hypothetical protein